MASPQKVDNARARTDRLSGSTPPSLRRNLSITFVGNAVYAGCQWAFLMMLAKLGGTEFVGYFSLVQAIILPILEAGNANLRVVQATDVSNEFEFSDYLGFRLGSLLVSLAVITLVVTLVGFSGWIIAFALILSLSKAIDGVTDAFFGWLQLSEQMGRIAHARMLLGIGQLICLVVCLAASPTLISAAIGFVVASAVVLSFVIAITSKVVVEKYKTGPRPSLAPRWVLGRLSQIGRTVLPMGIMTGLGLLNMMLPRYFVEYYDGPDRLGAFSAMVYCNQVSALVFNSCYHVAMPRLAKHYISDRTAFGKLLLKLMAMAVLVGCGMLIVAACFGTKVLTLLYSADFAQDPLVFVWLTVAAIFTHVGSAITAGLHAMRLFKVQPILNVILISSTLLGCYLLAPKCGMLGAAYGSVLGYLLWSIASGLVLVWHMSK